MIYIYLYVLVGCFFASNQVPAPLHTAINHKGLSLAKHFSQAALLGKWLLARFGQRVVLGGDWTIGTEETPGRFSPLSALGNGSDTVAAPPPQP